MKIRIEKEDKIIEKKISGKVIDILNSLDINPETVIVVKDDEIITEVDTLKETDEIKILNVVSGG